MSERSTRCGCNDLDRLSALEIVRLVRSRALSPVEVVSRSLERMETLQASLNAFVTATPEMALAAARRWEAALMRGDDLPVLCGVPISFKDNIAVRGAPLTFGSMTRGDGRASFDAPAVSRLLDAGACIVGKTTMTEFGCKASSDSPLSGVTRNPWDLSRSAGGSSSGSAASVAAAITPVAVGTDGAGSVRIPAAFCGVFGMKPQLGRVPVVPVPTAPSLLHIGPLTRTVRDAAVVLTAMAGYDARDFFASHGSMENLIAACDWEVGGWPVAWSATLGFATPDPEVLATVESAVGEFEALGCRVEPVDHISDDPYGIFLPEFLPGAAARLEDVLRRDRDLLDPSVAALLDGALTLSAVDHFRAHFARHELRQRMLRLFEKYRLLVTPTLPITAFEAEKDVPACRPGATVLSWPSYTLLHNLTGFPAASIPCGRTAAGLPVGLQIVAGPNREADLFAAAAAFESVRPWQRIPDSGCGNPRTLQ